MQHVHGQARAGFGVGAGVRDLALTQPTAVKKHIGLERGRARVAAHARQAHPVWAHGRHTGGADVSHHIGCDVSGRVMHFIEQLLFDGALVHQPAGAVGLADHAAAIGLDLGNRKAHVVEPRHVFHARVGKVTTADLRAAFEQMAGHGTAGQRVPLLAAPTKMRYRRAQRQRRVGHAAGHHNLRPGANGIRNLKSALINIGADKARGVKTFAQMRLHDGAACIVRQVIAAQHGNARGRKPELLGQALNQAGGALRVGCAEITDDGDAVRQALGQHGAQLQLEQRLVAQLRVTAFAQVLIGQRALGQVLVNHGRRAAARNQRAHHRQARVHAVSRKPCATTYRQCLHACPCMNRQQYGPIYTSSALTRRT